MSNWIDITVGIRNHMPHWPTDPAPDVHRVADMDAGEVCNVTAMSMAAHTGTHIDAPLHFIATGDSVDRMPLDVALGEARVITIDDPEVVTREELERHEPHRGERLLLKTANSDRCWRRNCFLKKFVHLNVDAARYLAKRGIRLVGIDYLSVGAYEADGVETHRVLLGAGIWALEGLDLSQVDAGRYELICLPLKLVGADGAPARAILRPLQ